MINKLPYKPFGILRFVLALMVLTQHFCADIAPEALKQIIFPWAPGNVAVLGFFIISGFIICEAYHYNYRDRPLAYLNNRLLRIVPAYWAALTLSIAVHFYFLHHYGHATSLDRHAIEPIHFEATNIIKNFLAIFPPIRVNVTPTETPFIPYAWALQTEMMFYLTVFAVGFGYKYLKPKFLSHDACLTLAAYAGILAAIFEQLGWLPRQMAYGSYFAFGGSLFFFLNGNRKALIVLIPALLQILVHFTTYAAEDFTTITANRAGQFLLLTIILFSIIRLATAHLRPTNLDKKAGDLSYSLYLNHYVIAIIILNSADNFSYEYLGLGLLGSLILTQTMFILVEKPLIKLRKNIREGTVPTK